MAHPAARSITSVYVFTYVAACVLARSVVLGGDELPKYKNHYYYLSPPEEMDFTEGNTLCHLHGGYLAEINDKEEFDFIANEILSGLADYKDIGIKIGVKWSGTEDAGKWVYMASGGDVTYTHPAPGYTLYQREGACLGLSRHRQNASWYMYSTRYDSHGTRSWMCSWKSNDHNLCEIPAAA